MADAHAKHHDYHLVNPSPWPIIGAASALVLAIGAVMSMKAMTVGGLRLGPFLLGAGALSLKSAGSKLPGIQETRS